MKVTVPVAATGARGFRRGEEEYAAGIISDAIGSLQVLPTEFITGAAWGADTLACQAGLAYWGVQCKHRIVVPDAPHNEALVKSVAKLKAVTVEYMPKGTDYMARNDRLVELCQLLLAFPSTASEVQRSGTWATVRRARKRDIRVDIRPLAV